MFSKSMATLALAGITFLASIGSAFAAAVDVNSADQAQLETIKGIGPAMSARILAERKKSTFKDWSDLETRVAGIGDRNAEAFSQRGLTVGGATKTAVASPSHPTKPATKVAKATTAEPAIARK